MTKDKEVIKDLAELIIEFFAVDENKKEFEKWQKNNPAGGNQQGTEQNALTKCSLSILEQGRTKVNGNARALQDKAV